MKNLLVVLFMFFLHVNSFGQGTFIKTINGMHFGRSIRLFQTNDQGIAVFSLDSLKLYKFNSCGNAEWAKRYKIPIGFYPGDIIKTQNGGYALLNRIPSGNIYYSVVTLLNASGTVIWSKSIEDPDYIQFPYTISEDVNGNFLVFANASPLVQQSYFNAITKLNANGNFLWTKFYEYGPIWGGAIITSDGGILARNGSTIYKTDSAGNVLWACNIGPTSHYLAPIEVSDGYIITGLTTNNTISFYKLNFQGNQIWGNRKILDFPGTPPLLCKKNNGNFSAVFNKTVSGLNYATVIEFDKDLNIIRQSTLNNQKAGVILQGLNVGFSDENNTILAGLTIANAAGSNLFFAKTNNLLRTGCDTTLTANITTEPIGQTFPRVTNVVSHTFNMVNKPFAVQTIPAIISTLCSNLIPAKLNIHSDSLLCPGSALILKDNSGNSLNSYLWSTGETTASITVTTPGKYWLRATYNCGSATTSDTVIVTNFMFPQPALTSDTAICQNGLVLINATLPGATYRWQDGSTNAVYQVTRPGKYEVDISISNCTKKFSVQIGDYEKLILPNVFTPNGDNRNDTFVPMEMCGVASGTLKIINRWGQLLFTTSDIGKGWNGMVNGTKKADGVYYYLMEYSDFRGQRKMKKGWVELVGN